MTSLRARAFMPALCLQLFIAFVISQQAFSQESRTTQTAQPALASTTEKVASKDEMCEQSPATTVPSASIEKIGAGKAQIVASQSSSFPFAPPARIVPARAFSFAANERAASNSFAAPHLSTPRDADPSGEQQTAAASPYTPLTSSEKMRRGFKAAFLTPQAYGLPLVSAILTEAGEDDLPHKDTEDRVADGLSRFAIKFGRRSTNNLLAGVYSSAFRQDPRYERADGKGIGARIGHAVSRVFVTRGDSGRLQPNFTRFASQLSASALSNLWEQSTPGHDRIGTDATFRRFGNSFLSGAINNVLREFGPDIKKIFGR
ncbi:MAG TPA: hypothetical protein VEY11_09740 [Pyrinomonadaceae bacterium]|nr:hypothetical protein [Pyrinomonadaceae bacterium]